MSQHEESTKATEFMTKTMTSKSMSSNPDRQISGDDENGSSQQTSDEKKQDAQKSTLSAPKKRVIENTNAKTTPAYWNSYSCFSGHVHSQNMKIRHMRTDPRSRIIFSFGFLTIPFYL